MVEVYLLKLRYFLIKPDKAYQYAVHLGLKIDLENTCQTLTLLIRIRNRVGMNNGFVN